MEHGEEGEGVRGEWSGDWRTRRSNSRSLLFCGCSLGILFRLKFVETALNVSVALLGTLWNAAYLLWNAGYFLWNAGELLWNVGDLLRNDGKPWNAGQPLWKVGQLLREVGYLLRNVGQLLWEA